MKLDKKSARIIFLALVALVYFVYARYTEITNSKSNNKSEVVYNYKDLIYTKHALCRMDCREVSKEEIQQILEEGKINNNKSNNNDKPCPTLAYEGVSDDGQHLRIVIARCETNVKVITAIDLDNEYNCYCD